MLTRWQPVGEMWSRVNRLRDEMDQLFGRFGWEGNGGQGLAGGYPALDVWEDEGSLFVEAELPGMELNDLEIFVTGGNQLSLRGDRKRPDAEQGSWHRQERDFGSFSRVVTLPLSVDADKVDAKFANGVLTITLPKAEAAKPRRIAVKTD